MTEPIIVGACMTAVTAMAAAIVTLFAMIIKAKADIVECQIDRIGLAAKCEGLKQALDLMSALDVMAPCYITATMPGLTISDAGGMTELMFGWTTAELIGKPVEMLIPTDFIQRHKNAVANASMKHEVRPGNISVNAYALHRKGHTVPCVVVLSEKSKEPWLITAQIQYRREA